LIPAGGLGLLAVGLARKSRLSARRLIRFLDDQAMHRSAEQLAMHPERDMIYTTPTLEAAEQVDAFLRDLLRCPPAAANKRGNK
jgi:hypothetical protein